MRNGGAELFGILSVVADEFGFYERRVVNEETYMEWPSFIS